MVTKAKANKVSMVGANTASQVLVKLAEGNKNFSAEKIAAVEPTSKRMIIWTSVAGSVPAILAGKEVTFNLKAIFTEHKNESVYIADSLRGKLKGYFEDKLGISLILTTVKIDGHKVKEFKLRKAVSKS